MKLRKSKDCARVIIVLVAGVLGLTSLSACMPATTGSNEGIGFRQQRFQEIEAMRDYRSCVEDALKIAEQVKTSGQTGGYRTSAQILERCESNLGGGAVQLAQEERMRNYALAITNYVKAGEVRKAREKLEVYRKTFDGYDLYLPNGYSFIDSMTVLTAKHDESFSIEGIPMMNISSTLRAEIQRVRFWKHN